MNSNSDVPQWMRPKDIRRRLDRAGAPQTALAYFADMSDGSISVGLARSAGFSEKAQQNISKALEFFEWLGEQTELPIDFRNVVALEPRFREFKKLSAASEVVGTNAE